MRIGLKRCRWLLMALVSHGGFLQAQTPTPALQTLVHTLGKVDDPMAQLNILRGINAAMKGQRNVAPPAEWAALYERLAQSPSAEIRQQAQALAVTFGAGAALDDLRLVLADEKLPLERRRAALDSLAGAKDAKSLPLFLGLVREGGGLRAAAIRSLSIYDDARVPAALLAAYPNLSSEEKRDTLAALTMRPAWAAALLEAIDAKAILRTALSAPLARQLQDLHDASVDAWLSKNWGAVRTSSAEKQKEISHLKSILTPVSLQKADPSHGRAIFAQTCAVCHTLFGAGAKIGPELPGAFDDVDYLLLNILDPNAIIGKDYQQTIVQQKDGQTLIGIVAGEDAATLTLKSLAGPVTLQRAEIAQRTVLDVSLMPEGLLTGRSEQEVRDLFAYLGRHGQVPMLATEANVGDFFDGTDLTHWQTTSTEAWKVAGGVIQGHAQGINPELLTSDMVVQKARITGELEVRGAGTAELVALDPEDPTVKLATYVLAADGSNQARPGQSVTVEVSSKDGQRTLRVNGGVDLAAHPAGSEASPADRGVVLGFRLQGAGSELNIRNLKVTLEPAH